MSKDKKGDARDYSEAEIEAILAPLAPGRCRCVALPEEHDRAAWGCFLRENSEADDRLRLAAPKLAEVVRDLCVSLACAGEDPKADSLNPLESLFARALAAYEAATGIADPFSFAMAKVCADNRAALASNSPATPETTTTSEGDAR